MLSEQLLPNELRNPYFEAVQMLKMRLTASMMEYMQAFGRNNPDQMNKAVQDLREIAVVLAEISHKTRVANLQKEPNNK